MTSVLVTGGTGGLGRRLVPRLVDAGHDVRVLSRRALPALPESAGAAVGDLLTGDGLAAAVAGTDVVVHAATSPFRRTRATEVEGTRRLAEAAREGTSHLLYISIVGVDRHPFPYYRAKWGAEQVVERSDLPWTIVRATQFHELLARAFRLPAVAVPRGTRFQPVDTGEVADRLVELVDKGPAGRVDDLGGPEVRTVPELAATYWSVRRRRVRVVPLPVIGGTARAFAEGVNLAPDHRVGTVTWEEFLQREGR